MTLQWYFVCADIWNIDSNKRHSGLLLDEDMCVNRSIECMTNGVTLSKPQLIISEWRLLRLMFQKSEQRKYHWSITSWGENNSRSPIDINSEPNCFCLYFLTYCPCSHTYYSCPGGGEAGGCGLGQPSCCPACDPHTLLGDGVELYLDYPIICNVLYDWIALTARYRLQSARRALSAQLRGDATPLVHSVGLSLITL